MRQGEILGPRWQDVDLDSGWLEVRHTLRRGDRVLAEPKTEQSRRTIALDEDTVAVLRSHRTNQLQARLAEPKWNDRDFVFCGRRGAPMHARVVLEVFHDALDVAGLPRRPFHQSPARLRDPHARERRGTRQHLKGARAFDARDDRGLLRAPHAWHLA